jgi:prepilin-type N-terminal cleavage/methylation domain-containing protein
MSNHKQQYRYFKAFTLVEIMMVVAIIGVVSAITLPHLPKMLDDQKKTNIKGAIRSQMSLAMAQAAKTQKISGVRFQYDKDGWKTGIQYMVLIERIPGGLSGQYQAVPYALPVPLPTGFGFITGVESDDVNLDDSHEELLPGDTPDPDNMGSATTFTILFSPEGQVVQRVVSLNPRNGNDNVINVFDSVKLPKYDPDNALLFCDAKYNDPDAMPWLGTKMSAIGLVLFHTGTVLGLPNPETRATDYFDSLPTLLLNMYTGDLFDEAIFDGWVGG